MPNEQDGQGAINPAGDFDAAVEENGEDKPISKSPLAPENPVPLNEGQEKILKLKKLLNIDKIQTDMETMRTQLDDLIIANNRLVKAIENSPPPNQSPGAEQSNEAARQWNSATQDEKINAALSIVESLSSAYAKVKGTEQSQAQNFDFRTFAVDFVGKMLNTQMDSLAMNAYQAPLKPPPWFRERAPQSYTTAPPAPAVVKKPFE